MKPDLNTKILRTAISEIDTLLAQERMYKEFTEILLFNPKLDRNNRFILMFEDGYITDQCMRVRRLVEPDGESLHRYLTSLEPRPDEDIDALQKAGEKIKKFSTKSYAHLAPDRKDYSAGFRDLDQVICQLRKMYVKYIRNIPEYSQLSEPINLDVPFQENWRDIFCQAWIPNRKKFIQFTNRDLSLKDWGH